MMFSGMVIEEFASWENQMSLNYSFEINHIT